ncbi:hypothetical protein [Streptacidiphilus cavernicola]|uniref:Uncharacterized protein n=1 Tax=Streptacidiphilus cavernicola TaxID=3342716 RepID=A0ABV6VY04_9ACTN
MSVLLSGCAGSRGDGGDGGYGTRNDIAVVWPSDGAAGAAADRATGGAAGGTAGGAPIVIAVLSDRGSAGASSDDSLIADATKAALAALGRAAGNGNG